MKWELCLCINLLTYHVYFSSVKWKLNNTASDFENLVNVSFIKTKLDLRFTNKIEMQTLITKNKIEHIKVNSALQK